jgi:hypothetical protein
MMDEYHIMDEDQIITDNTERRGTETRAMC